MARSCRSRSPDSEFSTRKAGGGGRCDWRPWESREMWSGKSFATLTCLQPVKGVALVGCQYLCARRACPVRYARSKRVQDSRHERTTDESLVVRAYRFGPTIKAGRVGSRDA